MKTLLALFFAVGTAYAQQPLLGGGGGAGGGSGGIGSYVVPSFTGSPQTITAATHGQGKDAIAICWFSTTPSTWTACGLTNSSPGTAGDIVLTYGATPSRVIIYTPAQQGPTGATGATGPAGSSSAAGPAGTIQASNGSGVLQTTACVDNATTVTCTEPLSAKSFTGTDTSVSSGVALNGLTSGTVQLAVADVAGTAIAYILPSTNGTAGQFLEDSGSTTCPTLASGSPATCHLLKWTSAVQTCGTTSACSHTALTSPQIVMGSAALVTGTPSTVTITGISPAFTSSSSYVCMVTAQTGAATALLSVANVSASSFTITGPAADTRVVNYQCVGN